MSTQISYLLTLQKDISALPHIVQTQQRKYVVIEVSNVFELPYGVSYVWLIGTTRQGKYQPLSVTARVRIIARMRFYGVLLSSDQLDLSMKSLLTLVSFDVDLSLWIKKYLWSKSKFLDRNKDCKSEWPQISSPVAPGNPKLTMTSQFPRKVSIDFSQIRGSGIRKKRKIWTCVFRKLTLLKSKLNRCFLLLSFLEALMRSNFDANFLGRLWHNKRFWIIWLVRGIPYNKSRESYKGEKVFHEKFMQSPFCRSNICIRYKSRFF